MMMGMSQMMNMMSMAQSAAGALAESAQASVAQPEAASKIIDPRVKELCQQYSNEQASMEALQDVMLGREDFDEDIQALHLLMERDCRKGKKPAEALRTHIRAMKANRFPGKALLDPDIWAFALKYELDDRILHKLVCLLADRKGTAKQDLRALDDRLKNTEKLAGLGLLYRLIEGMEETGRMP